MRPSISVTLEPGLERGVPWGRDLYTFVTSAAGHMMRTLQKPRKNRPSKRQVNHRRFLHNMIQRKFADIEAANHRLASALYFKEEEKNVPSLPSEQPASHDRSVSPSQSGFPQNPDKCSVDAGTDDISKSGRKVCVGSHETEICEKKQRDTGHLWKRHPKSQPAASTARKDQSEERQQQEDGNDKQAEITPMSSPKGLDYYHRAELFNCEFDDDEGALKSASNPSEDSETSQQESSFSQTVDASPSFSPELSPLSLDSCDFSIQMFADISTCTQTQKNVADISESQWTDIMDLFGAGGKDEGGSVDVEAYFESICACEGDAGEEVCAADAGFADQADCFTERICSSRCEVEDLHGETGEYTYEYGCSCHGDQGLTVNHFQGALRENQDATEAHFSSFKSSQSAEIMENQFPASISYNHNPSELQAFQHPQEANACMLLNCENNQNFTPFEGVAQSFSVPVHHSEQRLIPTPPYEDDWLFTDILKDRKSPAC